MMIQTSTSAAKARKGAIYAASVVVGVAISAQVTRPPVARSIATASVKDGDRRPVLMSCRVEASQPISLARWVSFVPVSAM